MKDTKPAIAAVSNHANWQSFGARRMSHIAFGEIGLSKLIGLIMAPSPSEAPRWTAAQLCETVSRIGTAGVHRRRLL